ncbi:hypothetical protein ABFX02_14G211100 [Erythranthe guttata]
MRDTVHFGGGGAVNSGGSMSALSREENAATAAISSSEDSSSYPDDDSELELGLGLSLGRGGGKPPPPPAAAGGGVGSWDQYARILTAKAPSSSSSSSSSPPAHSAVSSQVRGWPPIATHRINSLVNHTKSPVTEESASNVDNKRKNTTVAMDTINYRSSYTIKNVSTERGTALKKSLFVKVNMDGVSIGRKIDLHAHNCYETLGQTLDHMFTLDASACATRRSNVEEEIVIGGRGPHMRLLDGSSDFVLTYEDKDGDWMLVGDVPWDMFLSSVRRLHIRRTADANGLAPRFRGSN